MNLPGIWPGLHVPKKTRKKPVGGRYPDDLDVPDEADAKPLIDRFIET